MEPLGESPVTKAEERQHRSAIDQLTYDLHLSEPGVMYLYDFILKRYLRTARIRDFLPILVSRKVKDLLHESSGGDQHPIDLDGRRGRSQFP